MDLTLKVRLEGPAVAEGQIELRRLTKFGDTFQHLLDQIAASHLTDIDGYGEVKPPRRDTALRILGVESGSFVLKMGLQSDESPNLFSTGPEALEILFLGLNAINNQTDLPSGYSQQVLDLWQELGNSMLKDGIEKMNFELNTDTPTEKITYDLDLHEKVIKYIQPGQSRKRVLKGRFMIVNFNPHARIVRLYLEDGGFVKCIFGTDMVEKVQSSMRHHIRVWGLSKDETPSGKVRELHLMGLTILRQVEEDEEEVTPKDVDLVTNETIEYVTDREVDELSEYLLEKNKELYRRLAI